ncbi:MAG: general secretion pathway protein GspB [Pseudomonadota bacterium]
MSYILDALQRADAERARGGVPTLHARQPVNLTHSGRAGKQRRVWLAIVLALVLVAAVTAGLWFWRSAPTAGPVASTSMPAAQATPALPSVASAPAPAVATPTTPVPAAPVPSAAVALSPAPATASRVQAPAPVKPAPAVAVREPQPPKSKASASTPAHTPATAPPAITSANTPAAPAPVKAPAKEVGVAAAPLAPLLADLPEATRRQIPALAITGAVYSENPAQRLLLVNGQVLNQGSQVAPDLTLVEIRSNTSEFSFRGTRFRMGH